MSKTVLIIEDEDVLAKNIARYLERKEYQTHRARTAQQALSQAELLNPDLILVDYRLPDDNGISVIRNLRSNDQHVKIIMITGAGNIDVAVDAMRAGANDYLSKPITLAELSLRIDRLCADTILRNSLDYYQRRAAKDSGLDEILGHSDKITDVKYQITQLIDAEGRLIDGTMPAVLIRGATGTGKELVARALHFGGVRHKKPFVDVNCASIPEQLLESELFGHERGAFTDAKQSKTGLFEAAHKGTLFLDEIGDMHITLQAKLLRVLEDGKVRRLGAVRDRIVDTRIVAATNQNLESEIKRGNFRADLLYRLGVITITLPTLRERKADIVLLAEQFLKYSCLHYGRKGMHLTDDAKEALTEYSWPGNVRELRNVIERSVLTTDTDSIEENCLSLPSTPRNVLNSSNKPLSSPNESNKDRPEISISDDLNLTRAEIEYIKQALSASSGNITRAATLLGLGRDALRYKIEKHGIQPVHCTK